MKTLIIKSKTDNSLAVILIEIVDKDYMNLLLNVLNVHIKA